MKYEKHVFICTNQRPEGARKCCGEVKGMNLVKSFKKELKDRGLNVKMRAQRAGCMDICEYGPSVVVYPEGVFYGNVELKDVNEIVEQHLINNKKVKRLEIDFNSVDGNVKD